MKPNFTTHQRINEQDFRTYLSAIEIRIHPVRSNTFTEQSSEFILFICGCSI